MTEEEQDISQALQSLLHGHYSQQHHQRSSSSPNTATPPLASLSAVVQHLESTLGRDLSHKIDFVCSQIRKFLFQPSHLTNSSQKDHSTPHKTANCPPTPLYHASHPQESVAAVSTNMAPRGPKQSKSRRRGGPGGLSKLCGVSPKLEVIVGQPTLSRTEIVKQLWAYIRKNNLQDPNNKRLIICNDELRLLFETDSTDMFKMNKLLAKHIIPLEPTKQTGSRKPKVDGDSGARHALSTPSVAISEGLANFFGVGVREMLQSEVFTRLWEYIEVNNLEDPLNPMVILCDAKLQELFGCQSLPASRIPEVLAREHICRT